MLVQERQRALIRLLSASGVGPVRHLRVLEIGCGEGSNLLELLQLGFSPENLVGNELLDERCAVARRRLPAAIQVLPGDAGSLTLTAGSFDVVYQAGVLSSVLDDEVQEAIADRMWSLVKPGGGVLWYDLGYDNPKNPDVRGVPVSRIRELFPDGAARIRRVTLAPPLARRLARVSPVLYVLANSIPMLRTHVLAWIAKKDSGRH
jgi:SAM-dependent methyltransferase